MRFGEFSVRMILEKLKIAKIAKTTKIKNLTTQKYVKI